jgi:hypothetical protein
MSTPEYGSRRIWKRTPRKLRLIAALTGERIVLVLDRLAAQELQRVQHNAPETNANQQEPEP